MLASVLGMALSIEFGIAKTYALGVCFYVVCAAMIVGNRASRVDEPATSPISELGLALLVAAAVAPSIQPTQTEMAANTAKPLETAAVAPVGEVIE